MSTAHPNNAFFVGIELQLNPILIACTVAEIGKFKICISNIQLQYSGMHNLNLSVTNYHSIDSELGAILLCDNI
jgi:hypothetical protein